VLSLNLKFATDLQKTRYPISGKALLAKDKSWRRFDAPPNIRQRSRKEPAPHHSDSLFPSTPLHLKTTVAMATAELANAYAALILADDGVEITVNAHHNPPSKTPNPLTRTITVREAHQPDQGRGRARSRAHLVDTLR
jgi:hypothetical protein